MEDIKKLLMSIQSEIIETKNSVKNSETNLLQKLEERFDEAQKKLKMLEITVQSQENRLDFLEKQARIRNILIFGVHETEHDYEELMKLVLQIVNEKMKINCSNLEIEYMRRMGKKCGKPRPIIVTFTTLGRKIEVMKHKYLLQKHGYYLKQDYPPKVLEKRKLLQEQAREEREKGHTAYIKYDKLIILPQKEPKIQEKLDNIRDESQNILTPDTETKNTKKYKENNTQLMQKKNTLTSRRTPRQTTKTMKLESFFSPNPESTTTSNTKGLEQRKPLPPPTRVVSEEEYDYNLPI